MVKKIILLAIILVCTAILLFSCETDEHTTPDGRRYKLTETCISGYYDIESEWECEKSKIDTTWITNRIF